MEQIDDWSQKNMDDHKRDCLSCHQVNGWQHTGYLLEEYTAEYYTRFLGLLRSETRYKIYRVGG